MLIFLHNIIKNEKTDKLKMITCVKKKTHVLTLHIILYRLKVPKRAII